MRAGSGWDGRSRYNQTNKLSVKTREPPPPLLGESVSFINMNPFSVERERGANQSCSLPCIANVALWTGRTPCIHGVVLVVMLS